MIGVRRLRPGEIDLGTYNKSWDFHIDRITGRHMQLKHNITHKVVTVPAVGDVDDQKLLNFIICQIMEATGLNKQQIIDILFG
jgi:predicted RNA binding protein YcfA (HicA-like mRNA interferase family)